MSIRVTDFPTGPPLQGSIPNSANSIKEEIATLELYIQQLKTYQHKIKDRNDTECNFTVKNKENVDYSNSRFALKQNNVISEKENNDREPSKLSNTPCTPDDITVLEEEIVIIHPIQSSPDTNTYSQQPSVRSDGIRYSTRGKARRLRKLKTLVIPSKKLSAFKHSMRKVSKEQIAKEHSYSMLNKPHSSDNVTLRHLGQFSWSRLGLPERQYLCKLLNSFVNHCYSRQARRQILRKLGFSQSTDEVFNLVAEKFNCNRLNQIERTLDLGKTTCCHKAHLSSHFLAPVSRLKLPEYSKNCTRLLREFQLVDTHVTPVCIRKTLKSTVKPRHRSSFNSDTFNSRSLRRKKY